MFKKSIVSLVLLLVTASLFASVDLGITKVFSVTTEKISEDYLSSGAEVTVITHEEIEKIHPQTTVDILNTVDSVSVTDYGYIGATQSVSLRGAGSGRTQVYLNGSPITSAMDSSFDFSKIPASIVDRIEVVTSGSGKGGKTVATGGIVNIITKRADEDKLSVSFENGSFLPGKAGIKALVDSQNLSVTGMSKIYETGLVYSLNLQGAENNYSYYDKASNELKARENAGMYCMSASVGVNGEVGDFDYVSDNVVSYSSLRLPGSISWTTPDDWMKTLLLSTSNKVYYKDYRFDLSYNYSPLSCENSGEESEHKKHNIDLNATADYAINDSANLSPYVAINYDLVDSTDLKNNKVSRFNPKTGVSGNAAFGNFDLYALAEGSYVSDIKEFVPSATLSADYLIGQNIKVTTGASYSKNVPSFDKMYWKATLWGDYSNPNLKPESIISLSAGLDGHFGFVEYKAAGFIRSLENEIASGLDYKPYNIASSFYWGIDQNIKFKYEDLTFSAGWLFNNSFNTSYDVKLSEAKPVDYVRKNTLTFAASYNIEKFSIQAEGKYLGKYYCYGSEVNDSNVFILNVSVDYKVLENLNIYVKADNLLNKSYELSSGYPMPGLKIRLGANWSIL